MDILKALVFGEKSDVFRFAPSMEQERKSQSINSFVENAVTSPHFSLSSDESEINSQIILPVEENGTNQSFQVFRFVKMKLESRTLICLIRNLSANGGFLEVEKHYRGGIHKEDKGKIAEFRYLSENPTPENTFRGKIIRYYKDRHKKFLGVEFFFDKGQAK